MGDVRIPVGNGVRLDSPERQYMSPLPAPLMDAAPFEDGSGLLEMTASVVSRSDAIDAAFCNADRTTLVGSMTPPCTRFS